MMRRRKEVVPYLLEWAAEANVRPGPYAHRPVDVQDAWLRWLDTKYPELSAEAKQLWGPVQFKFLIKKTFPRWKWKNNAKRLRSLVMLSYVLGPERPKAVIGICPTCHQPCRMTPEKTPEKEELVGLLKALQDVDKEPQ